MYYDSETAYIEWDNSARVAILTWKKFGAGEAFKEPCLKTVELMKEKGAKFWFSDTQKLSTMDEADAAWFVSDMVPAIMALGVKEQALVVPQSVISKMSLTRATEEVDEKGLKTHYFPTREEALNWIKAQNP